MEISIATNVIQINFSANNTAVSVTFPPGSTHTLEDFYTVLRKNNIYNLISPDKINQTFQNRENEPTVTLKEGILPIDGQNGEIEYFFDTPSDEVTIEDDGTANFFTRNTTVIVEKDTVLACIHPGTPGTNGIDIFGRTIKARNGLTPSLSVNKNVSLSPDKMTATANITGKVEIVNGKICVENVHTIEGDVGLETGNIDFPGDVIVKGSVQRGFSITASGSVEIRTRIEGAQITAGGNVYIRHGVIGKAGTKITAGGDFSAKFIENATVDAGGDVRADVILHSNVTSNGSAFVNSGKSRIAGGYVCARDAVWAGTIGSETFTATEIRVGVDSAIVKECNIIEEKILSIAKKEHEPDKNTSEQLPDLIEQLKNMRSKISIKGSKIAVSKQVFPQVTMTIGTTSRTIKTVINHATFIEKEGKILEGLYFGPHDKVNKK